MAKFTIPCDHDFVPFVVQLEGIGPAARSGAHAITESVFDFPRIACIGSQAHLYFLLVIVHDVLAKLDQIGLVVP